MDHALDQVGARAESIRLGTRYFWIVFGVSVAAFAAWVAFGLYYNSHHDTKDAPLRVVIWILLGLASDAVIWTVALIAALAFAILTRRSKLA